MKKAAKLEYQEYLRKQVQYIINYELNVFKATLLSSHIHEMKVSFTTGRNVVKIDDGFVFLV